MQQTATAVVASPSGCDVSGLPVVASFRSVAVPNVVAMGPAVVVVETIMLFLAIGVWRTTWLPSVWAIV